MLLKPRITTAADRRSDLNLPANFNDLSGRQTEAVNSVNAVAVHEAEKEALPYHQPMSLPGAHNIIPPTEIKRL